MSNLWKYYLYVIWSAARDPEIYTKQYWLCMISKPAKDNKSYEWRIMCQGADPRKRFFLLQSSLGTTLPAVARGRWRIGTLVRSWWCACCNSSNISAACIVHTWFRRIMINLLEYLQPGAGWYHAGEAIRALKGPFQTSKCCKRWRQPLKFTFWR